MFPTRDYALGGIFLISLMFIAMKNVDTISYGLRISMGQVAELLWKDKQQILERLILCQDASRKFDPNEPVIYAITPTYKRPTQKGDLTRLSHTLMLVKNLHWILVEDAPSKTALVENLLKRTTLSYTHLNAETPSEYKYNGTEIVMDHAKGSEQRNTGLRWLREKKTPNDPGVIYFMDDDNIYSLQLFEEMRWTKEASIWPVAFAGGLAVEKPIVDELTGKVAGWNADYFPERKFAIDMAGFAVSLPHFLSLPGVEFHFNIASGTQETTFLEQVTTRERIEPKGKNCMEVMVWHVKTGDPNLGAEDKWKKEGRQPSDAGMEV